MIEKKLNEISKKMRKDILGMCYRCGENKAHLGGCLSMVEILTVLYTEVINLKRVVRWEERDRFIVSKGHGGIALYAALHQIGILTDYEVQAEMRGDKTITYRHPKRNTDKGIECSSGSLGMGLSYGIGLLCAFERKDNFYSKVYVMLGDGECNEGAIWEGAMYAAHKKMKNLVVIIDKNGLQLDGKTSDIMNMDNMGEKWEAFGFDVRVIDGHNYTDIYEALVKPSHLPIAIIAQTVKGKGISFAENKVEWHDNFLSKELYELGLLEIGESIG